MRLLLFKLTCMQAVFNVKMYAGFNCVFGAVFGDVQIVSDLD